MIDRDTGWYFTPTSIKAVVFFEEDVLLCLNPRGEWELPGGWPDRSDRCLEDTVRREVLEEAGIAVEVAGHVLSTLFRATKDVTVVLVILRATAYSKEVSAGGGEHTAVRFFPPDALPSPLPTVYASAIKEAVAIHRRTTT